VAGTVEGVDLAQTAGDVAMVLDGFLVQGRLGPEARQKLPEILNSLEAAVPAVAERGRNYFAIALELVALSRGALARFAA
jgi:hypothetical protein